jgi:hypothetical protein
MGVKRYELSDAQWDRVAPLLPGKAGDPGRTGADNRLFVNGVLSQDAFPLEGGTGHMGHSKPGPFPEKGPLSLQDHGNPMRFRNVWYRPLPPSPVEGGTDGYLTTEATMAKRKEIAASIREDAEKMADAGSLSQMLRYMESLVYAPDDAVLRKVEQAGADYVKKLKALPADQLAGKKDEVKSIAGDFKYMTRWKLLPASFGPALELDKLIKEQGWDKEKKK